MKKKVTVNIEFEIWDAFSRMALRHQVESGQKPSVSQYLENLISGRVTTREKLSPGESKVWVGTKRADVSFSKEETTSEIKPNERSKDWRSTVSTKLAGRSDEDRKVIHEHLVNQTSDLTTEEIEAANERLKAKREQAKKQKPKKLIKTPAEAREWSGGFSKSRQLGKK